MTDLRVFPHCRHCSWGHPAHVEVHHNACGCNESPYPPSRRTVDAYDTADVPLLGVGS